MSPVTGWFVSGIHVHHTPRPAQPGRISKYLQLSYGHHQGRKLKFCITDGPIVRTDGIVYDQRDVNGAVG